MTGSASRFSGLARNRWILISVEGEDVPRLATRDTLATALCALHQAGRGAVAYEIAGACGWCDWDGQQWTWSIASMREVA